MIKTQIINNKLIIIKLFQFNDLNTTHQHSIEINELNLQIVDLHLECDTKTERLTSDKNLLATIDAHQSQNDNRNGGDNTISICKTSVKSSPQILLKREIVETWTNPEGNNNFLNKI